MGQDSEQGVLTTLTEYLPGFETRVTNPLLHDTTTKYHAFDEPSTEAPRVITQSGGAVTEITRDVLGRTLALTRRSLDSSVLQTRSYVHDIHGRLCKSIEPETGATVMDYDAAGNLAWSAAGLNLPDPSQASCDPGRAAAVPSGRRVLRTYDTLNRVSYLGFPDGRGDQAFVYTPDGLPGQVTTNNTAGGAQVVNTYTYNRRRLLTAETSAQTNWYTWQISYGYDALGNRSSQTYPTGLWVDYAPNALGQATQAGPWATGVQYFPNGAIKQFTYGNGLVHTLTQNARLLPATSADTGGALNQTYHYDKNGNVNHVADALDGTRSRWMAYDGLDRLTDAGSAMFGGDHWHRFTYDALDNLRSWKLAGVKDNANYVYGPSNRLDEVRNTAGNLVHQFSYDAQGNLSNRNSVGHDFDYGNRLREVYGQEYYRYDGSGRRAMAGTATGGYTLSMYSQEGQVLFQYATPLQKSTENIYLGGSLVASRDWSFVTTLVTTKYQHTDALGSPVAVTNEAGAVIERTNYDPYGGAIGKVVDGVGYTGHVMDPLTGLTYMQQRYYDQGVGRFLSTDPVTSDTSNGGNFNRYWYANNNPYGFTDPDGRLACSKSFLKTDCVRQPQFPKNWGKGGGAEDVQLAENSESKEHDPVADYENERRMMAVRLADTSVAATDTVTEEAAGMLSGWAAVRGLRAIGSWIKFRQTLSKIEIRDHAFRDGPSRITRAEQEAVGKAIKTDIARHGLPPAGGVIQKTILVNGRQYSYRAFGLPNGNASVGTAVPGRFNRDVSVQPP